jgi:hypothetical protein
MLNSSFGNGTELTWLDKLECDGNEVDLALCKSDGWGVKHCDQQKATIYCGRYSNSVFVLLLNTHCYQLGVLLLRHWEGVKCHRFIQ